MHIRLLIPAAVAAAVLGVASSAAGSPPPPPPIVVGCNAGNASIIQDALSGAPTNATIQLASNCTYTIMTPISSSSGLQPVVKKTWTIVGGTGTTIDGNNGPTPFLVGKGGK